MTFESDDNLGLIEVAFGRPLTEQIADVAIDRLYDKSTREAALRTLYELSQEPDQYAWWNNSDHVGGEAVGSRINDRAVHSVLLLLLASEDEAIIDTAASLIASSAGESASSKILPTFISFPLNSSFRQVRLEGCSLEGTGMGFRIWECGIGLAVYFSTRPELIENKSILELGCGVGAVGVSLATCQRHPSKLVMTDISQENNLVENNCGHVDMEVLDWTQYQPKQEISGECSFDVVIAADVCYDVEHVDLVWNVLRGVKPKEVYITLKEGRDGVEHFLQRSLPGYRFSHEGLEKSLSRHDLAVASITSKILLIKGVRLD